MRSILNSSWMNHRPLVMAFLVVLTTYARNSIFLFLPMVHSLSDSSSIQFTSSSLRSSPISTFISSRSSRTHTHSNSIPFPTISNPKTLQLFAFPIGNNGKAASSPEEDLERTIHIVMQHQEKFNGDGHVNGESHGDTDQIRTLVNVGTNAKEEWTHDKIHLSSESGTPIVVHGSIPVPSSSSFSFLSNDNVETNNITTKKNNQAKNKMKKTATAIVVTLFLVLGTLVMKKGTFLI